MLPDVIAQLQEKGTAEALLIEAGELVLLAEVEQAAERLGLATGVFAAMALHRFCERAEDQDWTDLMGRMNRLASPGEAAVVFILARAIDDLREAAP